MTEQQIQRVLAEHRWSVRGDGGGKCGCGETFGWLGEQSLAAHRAHVAAKVAEALAAQVPDDGFCTTHPAVGREFCGCPAQVPDISARTICSNCEADLTVHCSSCGAIQ